MDSDKNAVSLQLHKPFSAREPSIQVRGMLIPGEYLFRLVVTDQAGNESQPALVSIKVENPASFWQLLRSSFAGLLRQASDVRSRVWGGS